MAPHEAIEARSIPATKPATTQIVFPDRRSIFFKPSMPSIIMLLRRYNEADETARETRRRKALPRATRHAMLWKGTKFAQR